MDSSTTVAHRQPGSEIVDDPWKSFEAVNELTLSNDGFSASPPLTQNNICGPASRLPSELLAEILFHATSHTTESLSLSQPPWIFGDVCHFWRAVIISTPRLWTSITSTLLQSETEPAILSALHLFLQRSGNRSLNIVISVFVVTSSHPVMDILITQSHRWSTLKLTCCDQLFLGLSSVRGRLQSLRRLDVRFPQNLPHSGQPVEYDAFMLADNLHHLILHRPFHSNTRYKLPWSQITRCDLIFLTLQDGWEVLRLLTHIVEFSLHVVSAYMGPFYVLGPLLIPTLRLLRLHLKFRQVFPGTLLGAIDAPALRELRLHSNSREIICGTVAEGLVDLIRSSGGSLQKLALQNIGMSDSQHTSLLQALPDHAVLELRDLADP